MKNETKSKDCSRRTGINVLKNWIKFIGTVYTLGA